MTDLNFKAKKTKNEIDVKLNSSKKTLNIKDHGVDRNPINQTIAWKLNNNVIDGDFIEFKWNSPVPAGTFGIPKIADDGNTLTVSVLNNPCTTEPERHYSYEISIMLNNIVYKSVTEDPSTADASLMMVRDPIIINR